MNPTRPPLPPGVRRVVLARAATPGSPIVVTPLGSSSSVPGRSIVLTPGSKPKLQTNLKGSVTIPAKAAAAAAPPTQPVAAAAAAPGVKTQEFTVRVPKVGKKHISLLRFLHGHRVDFSTGAVSMGSGAAKRAPTAAKDDGKPAACDVILQRENNQRVSKHNLGPDGQEPPRFGEGSEYRGAQRAEAKSARYHHHSRRHIYQPLDQPLMMSLVPPTPNVDKSKIKRYRGTKEGSIAKNVNYFVFVHSKNGSFDAYPVHDWYNMMPEIKYKHLNIDEAEEEFSKRNKTLNQFNIMVRKRMTLDPDEEERAGGSAGGGGEDGKPADKKKIKQMLDELGEGGGGKKKDRSFLLTDLEDASSRVLEEDDDDSDLEGAGGRRGAGGGNDSDDPSGRSTGRSRTTGRGRGGKVAAAAKSHRKAKLRRQVRGSDSEVDDESELDDHAGDDVDYMTHSSSDEEKLSEGERAKMYEVKGMDEEAGVKNLLLSESEQEPDEDEEAEAAAAAALRQKEAAVEETKKGRHRRRQEKAKKKRAADGADSSSGGANDSSSSSSSAAGSSSDSDVKPGGQKKGGAAAMSSGSLKRFSAPVDGGRVDAKRARTVAPPNVAPSSAAPSSAVPPSAVGSSNTTLSAAPASSSGISEETVTRYLRRKPMTARDLLRKFRAKTLELRPEQLAERIASVLKAMERRIEKKSMGGMIYLSLKSS